MKGCTRSILVGNSGLSGQLTADPLGNGNCRPNCGRLTDVVGDFDDIDHLNLRRKNGSIGLRTEPCSHAQAPQELAEKHGGSGG
jgi:hypothetical protein